MKIPKLEDFPLVEVRDTAKDEWEKRRLLCQTDAGHFICANEKTGLVIVWPQMREIKEPQMRRANSDEWKDWACSTKALGYVVSRNGVDYYPPQFRAYNADEAEQLKRAKMNPKGPGEFEYFMVPVEVEE